MKTYINLKITIILFAILVSGCGGGGSPELIAAFTGEGNQPREITSSQANWSLSGFLLLRVNKISSAESELRSKAANYGGYVIEKQSWDDEDFENRILVIRVPHSNFYSLLEKLKQVGELEAENVTESNNSSGVDHASQESDATITIHLFAEKPFLPKINISDWRPAVTLSKAFSVFVSIFGFLVDVLIWVIVVLGPFAIIGYGAVRIFSKYQERRQSK